MAPEELQVRCFRCGALIEAPGPPRFAGNAFCLTHFRENLRNGERDIIGDYIRFGVRSRSASAQTFLALYRQDARMRKYAALKIYEELMLASEDLAMIYFALRDRNTRPVVETLLELNITATWSREWLNDLGSPTEDVLARMGLLADGRPRGQWDDPDAQLRALNGMVEVMRVAAQNRVEMEGLMVQGLNKLKHGFVAVSLDNWVDQPQDPATTALILQTDRKFGRLNRLVVDASEARVKDYVEIVLERANAGTCALHAYLQTL